ncbi:hypothetical protein Lser_V15G11749 [Lactuca serriola]
MKTGDNNQQAPPRTSGEISGSLCSEALHINSLESSHEVRSYFDMVKVLSEVELPSPSPVQATSCTLRREDYFDRFHQGQYSSGTKNKSDDIEGNIIEKERELRSKPRDCQQSGSLREAAKSNITEKKRRNKISERIRTLQTPVPNCNKKHKASILGDAIEYIKFLQMQLQWTHDHSHGANQDMFYILNSYSFHHRHLSLCILLHLLQTQLFQQLPPKVDPPSLVNLYIMCQ